MKKAITISVITIIGLLLAVSIFLSIRSSRIIYNSDNAIGNSAGNLNNGGLFCEYNDKIYFANPYDYNKLYVMNSDCTNAMKLNDDSVASINVCGSYIYYVKNNFKQETIGTIFRGQLFGVYRCDLNGESLKALYDSLSGTIALSGNSLYYQHYSDTTPLAFHKVDIAGKKDTKISDTPYSPACVHNGTIYFSDPAGKHNILSYDTKTDKTSVLYDCNSYLADVENGYAYYIDLSKNYSLVRLNTSNKTLELLYGEKGNKVVVMGGDNYRIGLGGGSVSSVETGRYSSGIELNAVQRANAEMQKRAYNVVRALCEEDNNPIVSIHDHGSAGHVNCLSELVEENGGLIHMDKLPIGDQTLSAKEIIANESQERMGLLIDESAIEHVQKIADRERAPMKQPETPALLSNRPMGYVRSIWQ